MTAKTTPNSKAAKKTPSKAKAKPAATPAPESPKPDIIDAGGGILVEIAPPSARATKKEPAKTPTPTTPDVAETTAKAEKKPPTESKPKKMSALDAAATVLADAGEPMNAKALIEAMATKGLWTSPGGATPHATLYAAILREITAKGKDARFTKTERGKFALNGTDGRKPAAIPKVRKGKAAEPATEPMIPDGTPGPKSMSDLFRL